MTKFWMMVVAILTVGLLTGCADDDSCTDCSCNPELCDGDTDTDADSDLSETDSVETMLPGYVRLDINANRRNGEDSNLYYSVGVLFFNQCSGGARTAVDGDVYLDEQMLEIDTSSWEGPSYGLYLTCPAAALYLCTPHYLLIRLRSGEEMSVPVSAMCLPRITSLSAGAHISADLPLSISWNSDGAEPPSGMVEITLNPWSTMAPDTGFYEIPSEATAEPRPTNLVVGRGAYTELTSDLTPCGRLEVDYTDELDVVIE
jgi:hypothetical protein